MNLTRGIIAAGAIAAAGLWMSTSQAGGEGAGPVGNNSAMPAGDWRTINRDLAATRYSPLNQINGDNISNLQLAWSFKLHGGNSEAVPIAVGGTLYITSGDRIVALNGDSGQQVWEYVVPQDSPSSSSDESKRPRRRARVSNRGVGYWPGDDSHAPRIMFMAGSELIAVDAATGKPAEGFGDNGIVNVGVPYSGTPTIYRDIVEIGAAVQELPQGAAGNPRAYDAVTGKMLWSFQTVPQPGQPYNDTWGDGWKDRSGTNQWAFAAPVDAQRGIMYLPVGNPSPNYYGGLRPGSNVFGNSIVAVDAATGRYLWHFQTVHHDLWDADMPNGGLLFDAVRDGKRVPVIAQMDKTSYLFVLNRTDGVPYHKVVERPVPKGDVPGEYYAPTEPFPVTPPPVSRVSFTEDDLVTAADTTPEHAQACREFMKRSGGFYNAGPFTPFMYHEKGTPPQSTIQLPGGTGGIDWGGMAVNPNTGILYLNAHDTSLVGWVEKKDPNTTYSFDAVGSKQPYDRASVLGVGPFFSFTAPISGKYDDNGRPVGPSLPCFKPPWARLVAINVNTGKILWKSTLGLNELLPDGKQLVGNSGSAGPTVTGGGLVFVGATNDHRFRAFDSRTGTELWSAKIEKNANANPMSYQARNGKQFVAIVAGDTVDAFALK
ncbi:MAG TPA: PQQ-binding-like beta-propeller repeat protein [Gammaproteobacteria bacterium]|nr:PQQ-binding-like beta-propeller repeat protein [Gammaproteobacteria bacterium]